MWPSVVVEKGSTFALNYSVHGLEKEKKKLVSFFFPHFFYALFSMCFIFFYVSFWECLILLHVLQCCSSRTGMGCWIYLFKIQFIARQKIFLVKQHSCSRELWIKSRVILFASPWLQKILLLDSSHIFSFKFNLKECSNFCLVFYRHQQNVGVLHPEFKYSHKDALSAEFHLLAWLIPAPMECSCCSGGFKGAAVWGIHGSDFLCATQGSLRHKSEFFFFPALSSIHF